MCVCVSRLEDRITVYPADVVLFEGILVFYPQQVRDMFHMKLFVDTDSDVRLSRRGIGVFITYTVQTQFQRLQDYHRFHWIIVVFLPVVLRDMNRGRDLEQILTQYTTFVKPAFEEFCLPVSMMLITDCLFSSVRHSVKKYSSKLERFLLYQTKKYADVIIPRGVDNMGKCSLVTSSTHTPTSGMLNVYMFVSPVAINLIVQHIQDILNGDICKWQRGSSNGQGRSLKRATSEQCDLQNGTSKRVLMEPSSRPH